MVNLDPDIDKVLRLAGIKEPTNEQVAVADRLLMIHRDGAGNLKHNFVATLLHNRYGGTDG